MVLLPLPLWPTSATNSFSAMLKDASFTASNFCAAAEQPAANAVVLLQLFDLQDDVGGRSRGYRRVFGGFNVRHTGGVNAGDVMAGRDRHIRRLGLRGIPR